MAMDDKDREELEQELKEDFERRWRELQERAGMKDEITNRWSQPKPRPKSLNDPEQEHAPLFNKHWIPLYVALFCLCYYVAGMVQDAKSTPATPKTTTTKVLPQSTSTTTTRSECK